MKDIKNYEGLYAVTSCGRVWSYRLKKFMKLWDNGHGYLKVRLKKDNKSKIFYVHRLVAEAYISNPENLPTVNHKDENKANNSVNNLEYCTDAYNNLYGSRATMLSPCICVDTGYIYNSIAEASRANGASVCSISACCRGKSKTANGLHWQYVKEA